MTEAKINIAIDGFSSSGKSTLAKSLAAKLGYIYIDSGAMYRAATLYIQRHNINIDNTEELSESLHYINIEFKYIDDQLRIFLNDEDVSDEIRSLQVSSFVSEVAAVSMIRRKLVHIQQSLGVNKGVVMDGRDIGSVVFPNAELKIFLTANLEARIQRRLKDLLASGSDDVTADQVMQNLEHRDHIDSNRDDSPLIQTSDAIPMDNSSISFEELLEKALRLARQKISEVT